MDNIELIEFAKSTKSYVNNFLTTFDMQIIQLGPDEAITEYLCNFGNTWAKDIMTKLSMTDVFSIDEYLVLDKLDSCFYNLMDRPKGLAWNMLPKDDYLKIKSLIYDYLVLAYDLKYI